MAFHRIGDTILSDEELRAHNEAHANFLIPAIVTAIFEYFLYSWLSPMAFFIVHTTTAKVIYLVAGIMIFSAAYYYRKLILAIAMFAGAGCIFFLMGAVVWQWLSS